MNHLFTQIRRVLDSKGILATLEGGTLQISRTSMVEFASAVSEEEAYEQVLQLMQAEVEPPVQVYWGAKDDDCIQVGISGCDCDTCRAVWSGQPFYSPTGGD